MSRVLAWFSCGAASAVARVETEQVCAGGKMRGVTQRYRLKKREQHDV